MPLRRPTPPPPTRRAFLRASAASLALPALGPLARAAPTPTPALRLVCIGTFLGFHGPEFFPADVGRDGELPRILAPLERHRGRFTVFSGLDHRAGNGHHNWHNLLTGPSVEHASFDQLVAARIGHRTRLASLQVTCGNATEAGRLSFSDDGVALPPIGRPTVLYDTLFVPPDERARRRRHADGGGAVLDRVARDLDGLGAQVSAGEASVVDAFSSALAGVEGRLAKRRAWLDRPAPVADVPRPTFDPVSPALSLECESRMYELLACALAVDATRVATFVIPGEGQVFTLDGTPMITSYHGLSHHGYDPARIDGYVRIGVEHTRRLAAFLDVLATTPDADGRPLLDSTIVLYGSGMGDAHRHANDRLPILVAGGGFDHRGHVAIPRRGPDDDAPRLGDLFLTLARRMDVDLPHFAGVTQSLDDELRWA